MLFLRPLLACQQRGRNPPERKRPPALVWPAHCVFAYVKHVLGVSCEDPPVPHSEDTIFRRKRGQGATKINHADVILSRHHVGNANRLYSAALGASSAGGAAAACSDSLVSAAGAASAVPEPAAGASVSDEVQRVCSFHHQQ
jgi:hypothetical protein